MERLDTQRAFKDTNAALMDTMRSLTIDYDQNYQMPQKRLQKSLTDDAGEGGNKTALRLNFRKSHTCGSLFAKCNCSTTPPSLSLSSSSSSSLMTKSFSTRSEGFMNNNNNNTTIVINDENTSENDDDNILTNKNYDKSSKQFAAESFRRNSSTINDNCVPSDTGATKICANNTSISATDNLTISNSRNIVGSDKKSKKLFQSYSHPDTTFIFTDENKNPSGNPVAVRTTQKSVRTKGGKVEIKHPKRLSSPNIGNYAILDVAVHPEVLLKISTRNVSEDFQSYANGKISSSSSLSATSSLNTITSAETITTTASVIRKQNRPLLRRSERKECSSYSTDSEDSIETFHDSVIDSMTHGVSGSAQQLQSDLNQLYESNNSNNNNNNEKYKINENLEYLKYNAIGHQQLAESEKKFLDPAQKFFQESGILGPIVGNNSNNLIRRTSKIMQDPGVIEKIRKNSKLLRGSPEGRKGPNTASNNDDLDYIKTTISANMKIDNEPCDYRDDKIKSLQGEVSSLRDVIKDRDSEICKLKREIHKLKSVLQQTTNHISIADVGLQTHHGMHGKQLLKIPTAVDYHSNSSFNVINNNSNSGNKNGQMQYHDTCNNSNNSSGSLLDDYEGKQTTPTTATTTIATIPFTHNATIDGNNAILCANTTVVGNSEIITATGASAVCAGAAVGIGSKSNQLHVPVPVLKKQGVSGESSDAANHQSNNAPIPKFEKDFRSKQLIKDAIMDNDFLKNIDSSQVKELVESMYSLEIAKGEYVVREGEVGSHLYVSAEGEFEVIKNGQTLGLMGPGKAFGELAILYNCTRTASIRVLCDAEVWVLDRRVFQQIMMRTGMQRIEENVNFLKSVPLLKNLSNDILTKIADVLEVEFYPAGTYIIRQGASGDSFFLISQGSVKVTQKLPNSTEEKEIRILERGDYFGEQALINEDKRTANIIALDPGVECLTLDRESFTHLIGDLCELKQKNYGDEGRILATKVEEETVEVFGKNIRQELEDIKLDDLEVVATLGIGGFGRVELVKCYRDNQVQTFALKCLKKKHIIDTRQEEHVFSERTIMLSCNTPFICRLFRTFRDTKYVYMLLEACMGGEVWTILRDRGCFDENTTQFIIGCVLQAFEYLHSKGIIYRDLKPENLMLDERGYVKLVDFGFAKYIGHSNKTWTFCGTPEYVAPEIILNKGHDRAVDYWALGILIHELLNGTPPFTASDPMKTYNIILKGIDMIDFPKHMSRAAITLIKKLCRDVPAERLGYQKGGIQDIKKHKWFQGFDWDGLSNLTLIPPFLRPISHALDTSYFDKFPVDIDMPPDEISGWDADF